MDPNVIKTLRNIDVFCESYISELNEKSRLKIPMCNEVAQ